VVTSQDTRSQFRNREAAFDRLIERLVRLNHVPAKRVATKPTRASKERRIAQKKGRGATKQARGRVRGEE
jgi:protein subunit release factor B